MTTMTWTMVSSANPKPLRSLVGALLALVLVLGLAGATQAIDGVRFDEPAASGDFGGDVTFTTTFGADTPPLRVELVTRQPGERSDRVAIANVEREGDHWRASVSQGGYIAPNTSWRYHFRAVTPEGSVDGPSAGHRVVDRQFDWTLLEGERVRVWTYEGGQDFARRALRIAEEALDATATLLGIDELQPVDFFIYTDTSAFRQAMGPATRENVGGQAHIASRSLFGLIEPSQIDSDWVTEVISHELAHLVFHDVVDNPYQYPPRWLNEGVAVYLSRGHSEADRATVEAAARAGAIIPLEGLGGQFPTRASRQGLAYAESHEAVEYFVDTHGEPALVELLTAFGEGRGLDDAFRRATGGDFDAFDLAWLASLGAEPPTPYGPQPVEPGPVPDAWADAPRALLG